MSVTTAKFTAVATGLVMILLGGCSPSQPGTPSAPDGPSAGPSVLTPEGNGAPITVWVDDTRQKAVKDYQAKHPSLKITIEVIPEDQVSTKLSLAKSSQGNLPDAVFLALPSLITTLATNPLDYSASLNELLPPGALEKFAPGTIDKCTFAGRTVCLPNDLAQMVLWYNDTLMKQFGYEVPTTFDDYVELGKKAAAEHPGYLVGTVAGDVGLAGFYSSSGCQFATTTDQLSLTVATGDERCTRVTTAISQLVEAGSLTRASAYDPTFIKAGTDNKILMLPSPSWFGEFMFKPTYKTPKGQLAAAVMPTWPGESQPITGAAGGGLWTVSKTSANPVAAAALIAGVTTDPDLAGASATYPAGADAAEAWLAKRSADAYYASDPTPAMKTEAGLISPTQSYLRFNQQMLDAYNAEVVPALGSDRAATAWAGFGETVKAAAQTSGYSVP